MVEVERERVLSLAHITVWGDVSAQLPVPKALLFSWSAKNQLGGVPRSRFRARMTRLKSITAHRAPSAGDQT